MRQPILFLVAIAVFFFSSCKKSMHNEQASSNDLIASARNNFEHANKKNSSTNPRFAPSRTVEWDKVNEIDFQGTKAVIAPVQYSRPFYMGSSFDAERLYNSNEITWLCMYKDVAQQYHIEQVAFFPDSNYVQHGKFSGLISVDTWGGSALKKYKTQSNGMILQWKEIHQAQQQTGIAENGAQDDQLAIIGTCYVITGYNYSVDDPDNGEYWSEPGGCNYTLIEDGGAGPSYDYIAVVVGSSGSGGGGASSISPANNFTILNGNNPIGNIIAYNQCFTNIAGSGNTFSVTVCVDQPDPGTRNAWTISPAGAAGSSANGNPANVGHTFLIFTQNTGGTIITRNVGFYPATIVSPRSPAATGQFNDDELHEYNISLTIQVTNSEFFNMLNYVSQQNGTEYDLNTNNCTSFALKTLDAGAIFLPSTIGTWPGGSGNDPGDLGQDIMSLNLPSNMSRNTASSSHPNLGSCN